LITFQLLAVQLIANYNLKLFVQRIIPCENLNFFYRSQSYSPTFRYFSKQTVNKSSIADNTIDVENKIADFDIFARNLDDWNNNLKKI
jgi:hypothetical protein